MSRAIAAHRRHLTAPGGGRAQRAALAQAAAQRQHISFTWQFSITSRRTRQRTAAATASCRPARPALPPWPAPPSGNRHGRRPPARGRWQALPPPCRQRRHCRESEADSWQSRFTAHNASLAKSLHCNAAVPPLPSPAQPSPAQQLTLGLLLLQLPPLASSPGPVFSPVCVLLADRLPPPRRLALLPPHSPHSTS
jgi:hypothetical protein